MTTRYFLSPRQRKIPQMAQRVRPPQAVCRVAKTFAASGDAPTVPAALANAGHLSSNRARRRHGAVRECRSRRSSSVKGLIRCNKVVIDHDDQIPLSPSREVYECSPFTAFGIMPPATRWNKYRCILATWMPAFSRYNRAARCLEAKISLLRV